jgi:hypothetical protein
MSIGSLLKTTTLIVIAAIGLAQISGCANIVPPSGGPRDSLPPYLLVAKPHDSSVNINPKEIVIAFNEYISTDAVQENLIFSPTIKTMPLIDARLNMLRIRINDTLANNTTYSLKFGNAIKDVNEGNIAKGFTYVFSTGNYIDTGIFKGSVRIAETGEIDSTLLVVLHPINKDSAIFKDKPVYYTKLNGKGQFEFKFLPYQKFNAFVVPNDYTKRYDDSTKLFGFLNAPIEIKAQTDTQLFYVFEGAKKIEKKKTSSSATNKNAKKEGMSFLRYSKSLEGSEQDLLSDLLLSFDAPIQLNDSFPIQLCDTLNKPLDNVTLSIDSTQKLITIKYDWVESTKLHLIIPKKSVKDTLGNTLFKSDTLAFKTKSESAYGTVLIRMNNYQSFKNPILQLTKDNKVKFSYPMKQAIFRISKLPPGDYQLKLLLDENNNGIWDTGKYSQQKQPEIVIKLPTILNVKANWENEANVVLKM